MSRVKAGSVTRSRHKKILKRAKGYFEEEKILLKWPTKLLKKQDSMPIEIEK